MFSLMSDYTESSEPNCTLRGGAIGHGQRKNPLNFRADPFKVAEQGIFFFNFPSHCEEKAFSTFSSICQEIMYDL